jgi:hypothetical protein
LGVAHARYNIVGTAMVGGERNAWRQNATRRAGEVPALVIVATSAAGSVRRQGFQP